MIVLGNGERFSSSIQLKDTAFLTRLDPPIHVTDPWWHRRREFALIDRAMPALRIEQLDAETFAASLAVRDELKSREGEILQGVLGDRVRLKWFIDGHCAAEEVDGVLPSLLTLTPDKIPSDGGKHFITANLVGVLNQVHVASMWIKTGEGK